MIEDVCNQDNWLGLVWSDRLIELEHLPADESASLAAKSAIRVTT